MKGGVNLIMNYDERPRVAMNAKCLSKEMPDQLKL